MTTETPERCIIHCDLKRLIDYDLPDVVQRVIGSNPFRDSKIFSLSHRHACDMVIITVFTFIHWGQHQNKQFLPSEPVSGQLAWKSLNMKWQHWGHIFLLIGCNWDTLISLFLHMPISQHLDLTEIYFDLSFSLSFFFCLSYYTQWHCPHYCLSFQWNCGWLSHQKKGKIY